MKIARNANDIFIRCEMIAMSDVLGSTSTFVGKSHRIMSWVKPHFKVFVILFFNFKLLNRSKLSMKLQHLQRIILQLLFAVRVTTYMRMMA